MEANKRHGAKKRAAKLAMVERACRFCGSKPPVTLFVPKLGCSSCLEVYSRLKTMSVEQVTALLVESGFNIEGELIKVETP
jgi:hypothetical protein